MVLSQVRCLYLLLKLNSMNSAKPPPPDSCALRLYSRVVQEHFELLQDLLLLLLSHENLRGRKGDMVLAGTNCRDLLYLKPVQGYVVDAKEFGKRLKTVAAINYRELCQQNRARALTRYYAGYWYL